jgi:hypothetical protein
MDLREKLSSVTEDIWMVVSVMSIGPYPMDLAVFIDHYDQLLMIYLHLNIIYFRAKTEDLIWDNRLLGYCVSHKQT